MRFMRKFGLSLLITVVCLPASWAQIDVSQIMPVDPHVKIGRLSNGLTYYIRKNSLPEKRVELHLVVNAGSVLEDDDQHTANRHQQTILFRREPDAVHGEHRKGGTPLRHLQKEQHT